MLSERELAFIAIHKDSYPRVYRFVRRRVESAEIAEELAADVFRVVWQKWGDEPRSDLAWLLTVARNLVGNAYRSRDRQQALHDKLRSAAVRFGDDSDNVAVQDALAGLAGQGPGHSPARVLGRTEHRGNRRCPAMQ